MKQKIVAGLAALVLALGAVGCDRVERSKSEYGGKPEYQTEELETPSPCVSDVRLQLQYGSSPGKPIRVFYCKDDKGRELVCSRSIVDTDGSAQPTCYAAK